MEKVDRLFVNLTSDSFEDFVSRGKHYEVRAYGSKFNELNVYEGRRVELREAYNRRSLWTLVGKVFVGRLETFFDDVNFRKVEPRAESAGQAIKENAELLKHPDKYIVFEVLLNSK